MIYFTSLSSDSFTRDILCVLLQAFSIASCSQWSGVPIFYFTPAINYLWMCIMSPSDPFVIMMPVGIPAASSLSLFPLETPFHKGLKFSSVKLCFRQCTLSTWWDLWSVFWHKKSSLREKFVLTLMCIWIRILWQIFYKRQMSYNHKSNTIL